MRGFHCAGCSMLLNILQQLSSRGGSERTPACHMDPGLMCRPHRQQDQHLQQQMCCLARCLRARQRSQAAWRLALLRPCQLCEPLLQVAHAECHLAASAASLYAAAAGQPNL